MYELLRARYKRSQGPFTHPVDALLDDIIERIQNRGGKRFLVFADTALEEGVLLQSRGVEYWKLFLDVPEYSSIARAIGYCRVQIMYDS